MKGSWDTPERHSYDLARKRCMNSRDPQYKDYGGRGIEFRFKNFIEFQKELGPKPMGYILDRINNEGHYEVRNVRWASPTISAHNRRKWSTRTIYRGLEQIGNRWGAKIRKNHIQYRSSESFLTEEEAAKEYDKMAKNLYGEFAILNFPSIG